MIAQFLASVQAPAAGAPFVQIIIATVFAMGATGALLWLIAGHRSGRSQLLGRAGKFTGRHLGMAPWAALPTAIASIGLTAGGLGVFWDISLHIEVGRDEGPLANPSHYPILFALYSIFAAGLVSIALHERSAHPSPRAIRLPFGWSAPVGGALLLGAGIFALSGFPLDDVWHRMFGQDVTLWGPTHLIMINGAILTVPILIVLVLEAKRAAGVDMAAAPSSLSERLARLFLPGAFLFAIAFWATEFDWGVQQYRMVWHPLLLAVAGGLALVVGRLWLGRGGALQVAATFIVLRLLMNAFTIGMGQTGPAIPLFLAEAIVIELLFLRSAMPQKQPLRFGAIAGLVCGTVGFAAHYAWTQVASPAPWTVSMLPEALPTAILAGVAGGLLGGLMGAGLRGELPVRRVRRPVAIGATAVLVVLGANALHVSNPTDLRADVTLAAAPDRGEGREAFVTARVSDPEFIRDASMAYVLAWQGGLKTVDIAEVAPGVWRTEQPVPLSGEWKTMLRISHGRAMVSVPLHRPADLAIPSPAIVRPERFSATFLPDTRVMQSERKDYVPGWLWAPAALIMLLLCGVFIAGIAAGIARVTDPQDPGDRDRGTARGRSGARLPRIVARRLAASSGVTR